MNNEIKYSCDNCLFYSNTGCKSNILCIRGSNYFPSDAPNISYQEVKIKKKIAGVGACKHPNGRGKPSCEFTIDKVHYYFCYGYYNDWGDDISPYCEGCPAHIDAADDVLQQLIKGREKL